MRRRFFALVGLALAMCAAAAPAQAARIFRCIGAGGEQVFRDRPCAHAGLADERTRRPALFEPPATQQGSGPARCVFASRPLLIADPAFADTKLRLVIDVDDEGPFVHIASAGTYALEVTRALPADAAAGDARSADTAPGDTALFEAAETRADPGPSATLAPHPVDPRVVIARRQMPSMFDARVASQGVQLGDGGFVEAEWRMSEWTLGFGRSRMSKLLAALSRDQASLVVWFQGATRPVQSASIPAEEFRLAVDNARRCWKTLAQAR
jgi:hypothetical protein